MVMSEQILNVKDLVGGDSAFAPDFAEQIYLTAESSIKNNQKITIDFSGINVCPTAFLNIAIGRLFANFDFEQIKSCVTLKIPENQKSKFNLVVSVAKEKFMGKGKLG